MGKILSLSSLQGFFFFDEALIYLVFFSFFLNNVFLVKKINLTLFYTKNYFPFVALFFFFSHQNAECKHHEGGKTPIFFRYCVLIVRAFEDFNGNFFLISNFDFCFLKPFHKQTQKNKKKKCYIQQDSAKFLFWALVFGLRVPLPFFS